MSSFSSRGSVPCAALVNALHSLLIPMASNPRALAPEVVFSDQAMPGTVYLDVATVGRIPDCHRVVEVARLTDLPATVACDNFKVPESWRKPWGSMAGVVVFAPEARHPARRCPPGLAQELASRFRGRNSVLLGVDRAIDLPADFDLRARLACRMPWRSSR